MKGMLAKAGIGGAKPHLGLLRTAYRNGEAVAGYVQVSGGGTGQRIERLTVSVKQRNAAFPLAVTEYTELDITGPFAIEQGEERHFPFVYKLPLQEQEDAQTLFELVATLYIAGARRERDTAEIFIRTA